MATTGRTLIASGLGELSSSRWDGDAIRSFARDRWRAAADSVVGIVRFLRGLRARRTPPEGSTTLDRLLPEYDQREMLSRWIDAPPAAVWAALHETVAADLPLAKALMSVRSAGRTSLSGSLLAMRPDLQGLAETEGQEIVGGLVTKAWRPTPRILRLAPGADAFTAFNQPGWVKVAIDLRLTPEQRGTRLSTETRCKATDSRSRVAFALYWALIRIGSGLIRRETLAAIGRRAERMPSADKG